MNILGHIVTEASASVVRAPENLWLDDADTDTSAENTTPTDRKA